MSRLVKVKLLIILIAFGTAVNGCSRKKAELTEINYQTDLQSALSLARVEKMPLLIEFYRRDCPWSKMLDDSTLNSRIIVEMFEKMFFLKVDVEKDSAMARQFGIAYYPTMVVMGPGGEEIDRLVGYFPPADFYNEIQLYLQGRETIDDYLTRLKDEPARPEYMIALADKFRNRSEWDKAIGYYQQVLGLSLGDSNEFVQEALFQNAVLKGEKGDTTYLAAFQDYLQRSTDSNKIEDAMRKIPFYLAWNNKPRDALALYQKYLERYPRGSYVNWVKDRMDEIRNLQPQEK